MSDSSSEEDYDSQYEMLDGERQSSLFHFIRFIKDGDEQSSLPDLGEDGDTIGQSTNGVSNWLPKTASCCNWARSSPRSPRWRVELKHWKKRVQKTLVLCGWIGADHRPPVAK
uniref:Uncharacterized protein n=1 Tax=Amphimedon queenslandica TaxID=400682 RepID=A0A1X7TV29_AMPQE